MNTREFAIGHHSDIPRDGKPQLLRVDAGHKARGFPQSKLGYFTGYHFFIEEDGQWVQTRGLDERGAHADNCGCSIDLSGVPRSMINFRSIGICFAGAFQKDGKPTDAQLKAFHEILWSLQKMYGSRFLHHREVKATSCPVVDLRPLYAAEHYKWLEEDLRRKQHALDNVRGVRRTNLERAIAHLLRVLYPTP
jgi:N-acetyl-anhydromuramyl-L-alanine amidase AmpD